MKLNINNAKNINTGIPMNAINEINAPIMNAFCAFSGILLYILP